ncbi:hypothetical protein QUW40_04490 [Collinsella tanakaei]|uniref:hypothetical protein n=1 Tax=Collinsella tanakaei TaxID=626935 RepID=UPI0025A333DC|nr:hypothetical protein [Collinsella tanakaei]MDM8245856.1 hypothetical protein [Collinsella tanakaei]
MQKSTFLGNFIFWLVMAAISIAFLAWYNLSGDAPADIAQATPMLQVGMVVSAPILLYAIGAIIGLIVVYLKRIHVTNTTKTMCFIPATLVLALFIAAAAPVLSFGTQDGLAITTVIVVYAASMAPLMFVMFGALYAVGIAPIKE